MNDALKRAISKQTGATEEEVEALYGSASALNVKLWHFVHACESLGLIRKLGLN